MSDKIPTKKTEPKGLGFTFFDPSTKEGRMEASRASAGLVQSYQGAIARTTYKDFEPNISVRDGFGRQDYENFRPGEAIPKKKKDIIIYCMEAYRRVGIVHNIIDLMGDFCVQGIKIVHPNKQHQKLLRAWGKKVGMKDRSERYANLMFRAGNVVMRRAMARLPIAEQDIMTSQGADKLEPDMEYQGGLKTSRRNIPVSYTFLNPASLEVIGGELAAFTGKQVIGLKISTALKQKITNPTNAAERAMVEMVPKFIVEAIKQGRNVIPLEQEKLIVAHYKKDDWQDWADPITYSILDDLILLEKMKLADLAALDGAISQIRIWKLGDLDKGMLPTDDAIDKLAEILMSNPGGGAFDLIWGPDLKVEEYKTNVHLFLGGTKYEPVLRSIYAGLGVPPTLTGTDGATGTTNNFVSLQTMIQRLQYVRDKIIDFWEQELELVRQALGMQQGGKIVFDRMTLSDEAAEKSLLLQLWDRNLVSDEGILEKFKEIPDLELLRQRREKRERKRRLRPEKAGPYFPNEETREYIKAALSKGYIDPADLDLGFELSETPTPFDKELELTEKVAKMKGTAKVGGAKGKSGQGRPKGKGDSSKRSGRTFKVRTSAAFEPDTDTVDRFSDFMVANIWAKEAQRDINEIVNPILLRYYNKNTFRELSDTESINAEKVKFAVLANLSPFEHVSEEKVHELLISKCEIPTRFRLLSDKLVSRACEIHGRSPNVEERKNIQASVYALLR